MILTERDKKLLEFLAVIVILYGFVQFLILPEMERASALEAEIAAGEDERYLMEMKKVILPQLEKEAEKLQEDYKKKTELFYPMLSEQEAEQEITELLLQSGLEIQRLAVEQAANPSALQPYRFSGMAKELMESQENAEAAAYSEDIDFQELAGIQQTQIFAIQIQVKCTGRPEQLQEALDCLAEKAPAVQTDWYTVTGEGEKQGLDLGLSLYLCAQEDGAKAQETSGADASEEAAAPGADSMDKNAAEEEAAAWQE